jgi:UDP-N-acetylglucosamine--N-acetylmuramyl-(pentapeptide) pyrophosphoryl-undecaprenol N-acetylglucosamine transferase
VDGDQRMNAEAFAAAGAGWVMPQATFSAPALAARLAELFDTPARLAVAAARAASLGHADAAAALADVVERQMNQGRPA